MTDLLDPKNDYVFKRLFADAPDLLAALISAVRWRLPPVVTVTVKNPQVDADELRGKYIVLDLLAEDAQGGQYNVEMQVRRHAAWSARSTYYLARLIGGQLVSGDDYAELKPAVGIHLLDFDLFTDPAHQDQAVWCFEMRDADRPAVALGQEMQLNLIELRKADRLPHPPGPLSDWITLYRHWQEEQTMSQIQDPSVLAAFDRLQALSADAETRRLAFVRERALRDERSLLREAREDGRKEGRDEGRTEALTETARNLVRTTTLDDSTIAAATGLPITVVTALRQETSE